MITEFVRSIRHIIIDGSLMQKTEQIYSIKSTTAYEFDKTLLIVNCILVDRYVKGIGADHEMLIGNFISYLYYEKNNYLTYLFVCVVGLVF